MKVDAIKEGVVLDHIQAGKGLAILEAIEIKGTNHPVVLMIRAISQSMGRKDIIKIDGRFNLNLNMLGLLDPNMTVNYIEEGRVVKKTKISLPEKVEGLLDCKNPRCIVSSDRHATSSFTLVDREKRIYQCDFCGERIKI